MSMREKLVNTRTIIAALAAFAIITLSSFLNGYVFMSTLLKDIGFALLVSLFVYGAFEVFSRAEEENDWNQRIDQISKNVFFGVFKRNFPEQLMKEASELILDQVFVRDEMRVAYIFDDASYTHEDGRQIQFVKVSATTTYKIRNVSGSTRILPININLPNPIIQQMKDVCGVSSVAIKKGETSSYQDLKSANENFRISINDNSKPHAPFEVCEVAIAPDDFIEVTMVYTMAKEEEDSEIMQTFYPTAHIHVSITDRNPEIRRILARSIHRVQFPPLTTGARGVYHFTISNFVLPHQGFVIWWKRDARPSRNDPPS